MMWKKEKTNYTIHNRLKMKSDTNLLLKDLLALCSVSLKDNSTLKYS